MRVQDVVDTARYSELAGVAVKDNTDAIIAFLNLGMLELFKRFPLNTKEHIVDLVEGTTIYDLPTDYMYALSAYGESPEDTYDGITDVPINDEDEPYSIFFPNHKQVQIPLVASGAYVSIIYVAKPESYTSDNLDVELDLPDPLVDCLLHYIGYRAHLGVRGDGQAENNAHYTRFERSCQKARELGVSHPLDSWRMIDRLKDRGFA